MSKKSNFDLNDGAENPDEESVSTVRPAAPAPQLVTLTPEQFQQLLSAAQGSAATTNNQALADAITTGMQQMKEPIPENKVSTGISDANPLGDALHPRPGLKCEMWMAILDDVENRDHPTLKRWYEIEAKDLTAWEQCALNTLEPIEKVICRRGSDLPDLQVQVSAQRHAVTGALQQLMIAIPFKWVIKNSEYKNDIPPIVELVEQLTGHNFSRKNVDLEDLAFYMAEHRAGRYYGPNPPHETAVA